MKKLDFRPLLGLSSKHVQMIASVYSPKGKAPPSKEWLVDIGDHDKLSCQVSTPQHWDKTVVLVHGLGGCHTSRYLTRMARKFYNQGDKVVRINLRGCGTGKGMTKRPYCAGNSQDVLKVIQSLKKESPDSDIIVIGFSLGGNIILKLAGELGAEAKKLVHMFIAICPPLNLEETVMLIQQKGYKIYHRYYLKKVLKQAGPWVNKKVNTLYDYDDQFSGPLWGYKNAHDYYKHCSSIEYLSHIQCKTHILFAKDDPFVSIDHLKGISLRNEVEVYTTDYGSHLGFIGYTENKYDFQWLDQLLLKWVKDSSS